ncbi:HEAT repeat domain-containing protein [Streptomyces sp. NPDC012794]|uniref:HEAT repeat domain-containing protein n=1 Tax=Streptomyces sp. NPDC012794 TaxID=3364850 RepID=UPI0036928F6A
MGADEPLPLREAVDSGSPALVEQLLDAGVLGRYGRPELLEMRDRARHWYEAGAESELRRRTGSRDAVVRTRVQDDEYHGVDELTLGGMTVRDGHAAILTKLEELLGLRTPFEELMRRALLHGRDHSAWGTVTILLAHRRDRETWTAAEALRTRPDPAHRLFGAEVLRLTRLFDESDEDAFAGPSLDVLTDWPARETDPAVLAEVLKALGAHSDPRADAVILAHAGHHDAGVRREVANGFGTWTEPPGFSDEVREALLVLMTDPDARVRQGACLTAGRDRGRDPVLADAMAARLDDADRRVQVAAVYGLARHEDERCVAAARRLGPPRPGPNALDEEYSLDEARRYAWRRDGR